MPGIWDNQGYGKESEKLRHDFAGKGWYKRQIDIPRQWAGRRVFLVVTGASRYAKTWINDQFLGEHVGFLSNFEYDLTQHVTPGQTATLTIQVDSKQRWAIDTMFGACSMADYMDIEWGGIWGHVRLEARADAWLSDLFVQPDVPGSACTASATLNGHSRAPDGATLDVFDSTGQRVADAQVKLESKSAVLSQPVSVTTKIPNAKLWSPDSPILYTARLSLLKGTEVLDTVESRFGMRQFTIDGYHILLNGKRIMLRGYGDDHIYPEQMAMPSDKELHLRRLRTIKSYGFNHVRHHSTIMPPEYYDACDEVGMIANAEFPICYGEALPGGRWWQEKSPPGTTDPKPALETYRREWTAAVKQNRNHPSIFCWVMGNELYNAIAATALVLCRHCSTIRSHATVCRFRRSGRHSERASRPQHARYMVGAVPGVEQHLRQSRQIADAATQKAALRARGRQLCDFLPARSARSVSAQLQTVLAYRRPGEA